MNELKTAIKAKLAGIQQYVETNTVGNILNIDSEDLLFLQGAETVLEDVLVFLKTGQYPEGSYFPEDPEIDEQ